MRAGRSDERNLAAIGDSQTANRPGDGITTAMTYVAHASRVLGFGGYVNKGIGGNTTTQMLARFSADVLVHRPSHIIVMGGPNDLSSNVSGGSGGTWVGGGITPSTTKSNLKSMVEQGQAIGSSVLLATFAPIRQAAWLANDGDYLAAIAEIPGETGCLFADVYAVFDGLTSGELDDLYLDGSHPNASGQLLMANVLVAALQEA